MGTKDEFQVEYDCPCRTTTIQALGDKAVAYNTHRNWTDSEAEESASKIMRLYITDEMLDFIASIWRERNRSYLALCRKKK